MPEQLSTAAVSKRQTLTLKSGRTIELCQLTLRDYVQLQEQALADYKRRQIKTWTENLDLIPEEQRADWIRDAFAKAAEVKMEDLPAKTMLVPKTTSDGQMVRRGGKGGKIVTIEKEVPYSAWWMSETAEGKMHATWLSMRHAEGQEEFTLDDASEIFTDAFMDLETAAQVVGEISQSRLEGNSDAPDEEGAETTKETTTSDA